MGSDEFVLVLTELRSPQDAAVVAQRIGDALAPPFRIGDSEVHISASMGISTFPVDGGNVGTLFKCANAAMYHAKEGGRKRFQFNSRAIHERGAKRLALEVELRRALERGQSEFVYQPKVDILYSRPVAPEALVGWLENRHRMDERKAG